MWSSPVACPHHTTKTAKRNRHERMSPDCPQQADGAEPPGGRSRAGAGFGELRWRGRLDEEFPEQGIAYARDPQSHFAARLCVRWVHPPFTDRGGLYSFAKCSRAWLIRVGFAGKRAMTFGRISVDGGRMCRLPSCINERHTTNLGPRAADRRLWNALSWLNTVLRWSSSSRGTGTTRADGGALPPASTPTALRFGRSRDRS